MEALTAALEAAASGAAMARPTSLVHVMDSETILGVLADKSVVERLLPLLPEGQQTEEHLREIVRAGWPLWRRRVELHLTNGACVAEQITSPQLRAAVGSLSGALGTENLNSVFANFGLNPVDGSDEMARGDGAGAFLSALQAAVDRSRSEEDDAGADGGDGGADS